MKDHSETGIVEATARYEAWLAQRIPVVKPDLEQKHRAMSAGIFPFFRATFYRWADRWRALSGDIAAAPTVLAGGGPPPGKLRPRGGPGGGRGGGLHDISADGPPRAHKDLAG